MNLETFIAICEVMEDEFAKSMRKQGMYITQKKKKDLDLNLIETLI
jgi:hypothetical protein